MPTPSEVVEARPAPLSPPNDRPLTSIESAASLARRLDRSTRSIDRWILSGVLPEPFRIRGRRYWPAGTMPKFDAPDAPVSPSVLAMKAARRAP
jgi:hypothetical protein